MTTRISTMSTPDVIPVCMACDATLSAQDHVELCLGCYEALFTEPQKPTGVGRQIPHGRFQTLETANSEGRCVSISRVAPSLLSAIRAKSLTATLRGLFVAEVVNGQKIRNDALRRGALDPMCLRYRVLEYDKSGGGLIGIRAEDLGFREAVEKTQVWIEINPGSHFCLEPVGFLH